MRQKCGILLCTYFNGEGFGAAGVFLMTIYNRIFHEVQKEMNVYAEGIFVWVLYKEETKRDIPYVRILIVQVYWYGGRVENKKEHVYLTNIGKDN